MNLKLSGRERFLLIVTLLCVIFFFYWQSRLSPLLKTMAKTRVEIASLRLQLEQATLPLVKMLPPQQQEIKIYPQEEQLNYIIKFIDRKFRWFGIRLISLRQSTGDNKLTIELKFKCSPYQFLGFLNSLPDIKTVLIIDQAKVSQEEDKVVAEMKLLSAYK